LFTIDRIANTIRVKSVNGDDSCDATGPLNAGGDYVPIF